MWDGNPQTTFTFVAGGTQHLKWNIRLLPQTSLRCKREAVHPSHTLSLRQSARLPLNHTFDLIQVFCGTLAASRPDTGLRSQDKETACIEFA
jgi:hypothetical protein